MSPGEGTEVDLRRGLGWKYTKRDADDPSTIVERRSRGGGTSFNRRKGGLYQVSMTIVTTTHRQGGYSVAPAAYVYVGTVYACKRGIQSLNNSVGHDGIYRTYANDDEPIWILEEHRNIGI
ncbi:hypothetical protein FRB91_008283 [Serendipita sp. 411]|nr:hypothetical protein FRB91_008283 [Serendipita sp. 411]